MTERRIELLNKIGFDWDCRIWGEMYDELVKYVEEFGDAKVPARFPQNQSLGNWVRHQRLNYKRVHNEDYKRTHKTDSIYTMSEDRIQLLNKIGFNWTIRETKLVFTG